MHCTATGKILLAFGTRALVDEVVALPLERRTPRTVATPGLLLQELARARDLGYAAEHEQTRLGYLSVAVPLLGSTGATAGALAVTAPLVRGDVPKFAGLLGMVARRITTTLASE